MIEKLSTIKVRENRENALKKIESLLSSGEFKNLPIPMNNWDDRKFVVTWNENYKGMVVEKGLDLCDGPYESFSGFKCILVIRNLFIQKQVKGYPSVEMGLLSVGLALCVHFGRERSEAFYKEYCTPYNNRLEEQRKKSENK